ncbi:hypothetical protein WN51_10442 [Melipona quadrifasciata]|uniref:Uncharacterized protein n=1 Tax=Melipona quadrifasciata TaxID=166423 RepID=A0A0N0BI51_9HYME|nr:hypothetical protein WN51_10442 [Melipona quadrifasciata]
MRVLYVEAFGNCFPLTDGALEATKLEPSDPEDDEAMNAKITLCQGRAPEELGRWHVICRTDNAMLIEWNIGQPVSINHGKDKGIKEKGQTRGRTGRGTPGRGVVWTSREKEKERERERKEEMGASRARRRRSGGLEAASRCIASGPIVGPHNTVFWGLTHVPFRLTLRGGCWRWRGAKAVGVGLRTGPELRLDIHTSSYLGTHTQSGPLSVPITACTEGHDHACPFLSIPSSF